VLNVIGLGRADDFGRISPTHVLFLGHIPRMGGLKRNPNMTTEEIGKELVSLSQQGKGLEAVDRLYDEKVVSIEAQGGDALPQRMEGIESVRGKNAWWYDNLEVHASTAAGPYCGHREDQFGAHFEMDVTFKPAGERQKLMEIALYTVKNDKIVEEEFWYHVG
jgi:hypothetical protein